MTRSGTAGHSTRLSSKRPSMVYALVDGAPVAGRGGLQRMPFAFAAGFNFPRLRTGEKTHASSTSRGPCTCSPGRSGPSSTFALSNMVQPEGIDGGGGKTYGDG